MRRIKPRATCMHDCFPCICASSPRYLFEYLLDFLPSPAAGAGAHILAGGLSSVRRHQSNVPARNRVPPTRVAADRAQSREFVRGAQFGYAAMQTGACDAAITSSTSLISFRLEEVAKSLTTGRGKSYWFMLEPLIMSKAIFDAMPKNQKDIIVALGEEMES